MTDRPDPPATCRTCRHWNTSEPVRDEGVCRRISRAETADAWLEEDEMPAWPSTTLVTSPDFGCTLHEEAQP